MRRKHLFFIGVLIFVVLSFSVSVSADESESALDMPSEFGELLDSLPKEIIDKLPEGFFSSDPEDISEGIKEISKPQMLLGMLLDGILMGARSLSPSFSIAIGIIVLSSVAGMISAGMGNNTAVGVVLRLCTVGVILSLVYASINTVSAYFDSLCKMAAAYIPLAATLYAMGGNVSAAVASTSSFGACLSICQFIFTYTAIPTFVFCAVMSTVTAFDGSRVITRITDGVKKGYTVLLSFVMTALGIGLSAQTFISAKADSASMRGAKLLIGSFIPHTGGSVSSSLGAVATGIELIRGSVGIGGIIIIFMMLIPVICHLVTMKLFLFVLEVISGAVGGADTVIAQISSLYSYLLGVACISSVIFILSFATLGLCAAAIG